MIRLTSSEVKVLELSMQGLTNKEIGKRLGVSGSTANGFASRAQRKLGVRNRAAAVAVAITSKLIKGPKPVAATVGDRPRRPMADFLEDYVILERRGLPRTDIAKALGVHPDTVARMICRARAAGLLPPYKGRRS